MGSLTCLGLAVAAALVAQGSAAQRVQEALARHAHEPGCAEVVAEAQKTAAKGKKAKVPSVKALHASALLPLVRVTLTKDLGYDETFAVVPGSDTTMKVYTDDSLELKVTAQWDLSALVYNPAESALIAQAAAEEKARLELAQLAVGAYHQRKKLLVMLDLFGESAPPETALDWRVRADELTALLDALTAGWFTAESKKRLAKKKAKTNGK